MISVITGDIINSRNITPILWLSPLKQLLSTWGKSPKSWEIYRGDSFQLEIKQPQDALLTAIRIKACIRSINGLDVRMGIGIGERNYDAARITEANGQAYIFSGEIFEDLNKLKSLLAIKSPWPALDKELNLMFRLSSAIFDKWTPITAQLVTASITNNTLSQKELGDKLERTQSTISEGQKRAHYEEIMDLERFFDQAIQEKIHQT